MMKVYQLLKSNIHLEILFLVLAIFAGLNFQLNWFSLRIGEIGDQTLIDYLNPQWWGKYNMNLRLFIGAISLPLVLYFFRFLLYHFLLKQEKFNSTLQKYAKHESLGYLPLLLSGMGYFGYEINTFLIISLILVIQIFIFFHFYTQNIQLEMNIGKIKNHQLYLLFFLSGFAALIYQVVWQRALFMFFGVNIETVTIIVSIFMLGLGLGALMGGYLAKKYPMHLPHLFALLEAFIGIFGFFSLYIFEKIYFVTIHSSAQNILFIVYLVLLIPTICMGATLPILVEYFYSSIKKVGKTVSFLYFINTIGSALASFYTVKVFFIYFGMHTTILIASTCNILVSILGYWFIKKYINNPELNIHNSNLSDNTLKVSKSMIFMLGLSFITGYLAMSQEILWIRLISYFTGGKPEVFAILVGMVLMGIALGALSANKICEIYKGKLIEVIAWVLMISALLYFSSMPLFSFLAPKLQNDNVIPFLYFMALLISFLMGINFPLITHHAITTGVGVGKQVSWIYFANIVGSTLGPLVTGFVLFDKFTFEQNTLFITILIFLTSVIIWLYAVKKLTLKKLYFPLFVFLMLITLFNYPRLYHHFFERIQFQNWYWGQSLKYLIQNRHGIIAVIEEEKGDDVIIGGGLYDGRFNYLLSHNRNMIDRAYAFAALKPDTRTILEIGLSAGSWTNVLAMYRNIERIDVVEINPGYIEIIKKYPSHVGILSNPKVNIYIDDARRWLNKTDKKYDFILMNTTYHWRSQINNLVSKEFLELCKQHLNPGGVMYYNTTGSGDIIYTAAHVFNYITRYSNFVACSDNPFPSDTLLKLNALKNFEINGQSLYIIGDSSTLKAFEIIIHTDFHTNIRENILKQDYRYLITDDNLASEFKTPYRVYNRNKAWYRLLKI